MPSGDLKGLDPAQIEKENRNEQHNGNTKCRAKECANGNQGTPEPAPRSHWLPLHGRHFKIRTVRESGQVLRILRIHRNNSETGSRHMVTADTRNRGVQRMGRLKPVTAKLLIEKR